MEDSGPARAEDARLRPAREPAGHEAGLEVVRARATAAGGLFAAATAAFLLAIVSQDGPVPAGPSVQVLIATGAAYGLAVACFLVAAVLGPPQPLRYLVLAGTVLGVVAVLGTVGAAILTVLDDQGEEETVWVYVRQDIVLHDLRHSCAGLPHPFQARVDVEELAQPVVHVEVTCKDKATTFVLPAADVFVVTP